MAGHYEGAVTAPKTASRSRGPNKPKQATRSQTPANGSAKTTDSSPARATKTKQRITLRPPVPVGPKPTREEALKSFKILLRYMGDNPEREGLLETPDRVLRSYDEHFSGYHQDPSEHLSKTFTEVEDYNELVLVSDIEVFSHCEHHLVPFVGKAHVAYIPDGRVVGLSKLARVVDVFAKRLQVQEKLTAQISGAIAHHLEPLGVAVIMQCQHFCMCYRGVRKPGSWTTTSKLHGLFLSDHAARTELLTLLGLHREIGGAGGA
jgi:GTP cyclohydrolase IA